MSVLTPTNDQKSKVHFSEYIKTLISRSDEPKPAESSEEAETVKPAEPTAS